MIFLFYPLGGSKLPKKKEEIPFKWLELCLNQCEKFLMSLAHEDIDDHSDVRYEF
jgi:hypothetical protein